MIEFRLSVEALGNTRFGYSPLAEVAASSLREMLGEPNPGRRVADAIWQYWETAIAPYWSRIRAVVDDDGAYRGGRAVSGGVFSLFEDLHPEVTLRDHVLEIDKPHHDDQSYTGAQITLVPSVFVWPNLIIGHEGANHFSLTYAARGVARVWEGLPVTDAAAGDLGALVGRTRAALLHRLRDPHDHHPARP